MPDSLWIGGIVGYVLAWAWLAERRERAMRKAEDLLDTWTPIVEARPEGRRFERKFHEYGATWEPLEEDVALRVLASLVYDVPKAIEEMRKGRTFQTSLGMYRLLA